MSSAREGLAGGDRGKDRDHVAVGHGRLERTEEADVLVVEVHVDEPVKLAAFGHDRAAHTRVLLIEILDHLTDRRPRPVDGFFARRVLPQDRRHPYFHAHPSPQLAFSSETTPSSSILPSRIRNARISGRARSWRETSA